MYIQFGRNPKGWGKGLKPGGNPRDKTPIINTKNILERFKMRQCKPAKTPLPRDSNLSLMDSPDQVNPQLQSGYRGIVGSLMYLYQWTRPDLGFAVVFLSRYRHKPGDKHLQAAKHILHYLKGTVEL